MIDIKECGHSVETTARWHRQHPDRCFYCEYLENHPRTLTRIGNKTTEFRVAHSQRMKKVWKARKTKIVP